MNRTQLFALFGLGNLMLVGGIAIFCVISGFDVRGVIGAGVLLIVLDAFALPAILRLKPQ